jgi:hypothetical protein
MPVVPAAGGAILVKQLAREAKACLVQILDRTIGLQHTALTREKEKKRKEQLVGLKSASFSLLRAKAQPDTNPWTMTGLPSLLGPSCNEKAASSQGARLVQART